VASVVVGGGGALLKNQPAISAATTAATPRPAHRPVRRGARGTGGGAKPMPAAGTGLGRVRSIAVATDASRFAGGAASPSGAAGLEDSDDAVLGGDAGADSATRALRLARPAPHFAQ
jgi:hypothetical protein